MFCELGRKIVILSIVHAADQSGRFTITMQDLINDIIHSYFDRTLAALELLLPSDFPFFLDRKHEYTYFVLALLLCNNPLTFPNSRSTPPFPAYAFSIVPYTACNVSPADLDTFPPNV